MNALTAYITQKDAERDLHYCPVCRDRYPQEDMDLGNFWTHSQAMRDKFNGACCRGCVDEYMTTADGVLMPRDATVFDGYDHWSSEDALADAIYEAGGR